jgi:predicted ATPase
MYTDGLTETMNIAKAQFGVPRMLQAVKAASSRNARAVVEDLMDSVLAFRGKAKNEDDLTLLALRYVRKESGTTRITARGGRSIWPTNLRPESTSFIGREKELELISGHFDSDAALVTVMGPGGTGKTRLVRKAGHTLLDKFPGGVWHVELGEAGSVADIAAAVAQALSIPLTENLPPEQAVADALEYRQPTLLVLDGFEHLVSFATATVGLWRSAASGVRFLVASEAPLGIPGERELRLEPLAVPPKGASRRQDPLELVRFDAVELFVQRAMEARPGFCLDAENASDVGDLCYELEGIPLAIELAASRLKLLSPGQLLVQMRSHTRKLAALAPAEGTRTLDGAMGLTYGRLAPWEALAFEQLCIFRGGFTVEAAGAVLDLAAHSGAPDAAGAVQGLSDHSLLQVRQTPYGPRFEMLNTVREFGRRKRRDRLDENQQDELSLRYAQHYIDYGEEWSKRFRTRRGLEVIERLALEYQNFRAAHDSLLIMKRRDLAARLALAFDRLLETRGPLAERQSRLESSNKGLKDGSDLQLRVLCAIASSLLDAGQNDKAGKTARTVLQQCGTRPSEHAIDALILLAQLALQSGDGEACLRGLEQATQIAQRWQDYRLRFAVTSEKARALAKLGRSEESLKLLTEAESLAKSAGDVPGLGAVETTRALALAELGRPDAAAAIERAQRHFLSLGDRRRYAAALTVRGAIELRLGRAEKATGPLQESAEIGRELGSEPLLREGRPHLLQLALARGAYDEALKLAGEAGTALAPEDRARLEGAAAYIEMKRGNFSGALERCEAGLAAIADETHALALQLAGLKAVCMANLGRPNESLHLVERASSLMRKIQGEPSVPARFVLACVRASILAGRRETSQALASATTARQIAAENGFDKNAVDPFIRAGFELLSGSPPPQR